MTNKSINTIAAKERGAAIFAKAMLKSFSCKIAAINAQSIEWFGGYKGMEISISFDTPYSRRMDRAIFKMNGFPIRVFPFELSNEHTCNINNQKHNSQRKEEKSV